MVKNIDYSAVDSAPLGKRKKIEDDLANGPLKKQRTRVRYAVQLSSIHLYDRSRSFSCGECHRRKQKVIPPSILVSYPYQAPSATAKSHVLMSVHFTAIRLHGK